MTCQLRIEEYTISGYTMPSDKETDLGISNQEASLSEAENARVVLQPCHSRKCGPIATSSDVDLSKLLWCHLLR